MIDVRYACTCNGQIRVSMTAAIDNYYFPTGLRTRINFTYISYWEQLKLHRLRNRIRDENLSGDLRMPLGNAIITANDNHDLTVK